MIFRSARYAEHANQRLPNSTPSPIRTLPSAPEFHRILPLESSSRSRALTAGQDLAVITRGLTKPRRLSVLKTTESQGLRQLFAWDENTTRRSYGPVGPPLPTPSISGFRIEESAMAQSQEMRRRRSAGGRSCAYGSRQSRKPQAQGARNPLQEESTNTRHEAARLESNHE